MENFKTTEEEENLNKIEAKELIEVYYSKKTEFTKENCIEMMIKYSEGWIDVTEGPGTEEWKEKFLSRWRSFEQFLAIIDGEYHIVRVDQNPATEEESIIDVNTGELFSEFSITSWKKL